jgi:hypothetical protein
MAAKGAFPNANEETDPADEPELGRLRAEEPGRLSE